MRYGFLAIAVILILFRPIELAWGQSDKDLPSLNKEGEFNQIVELGPLSNKESILNDPLLPAIACHVREKYGVQSVILYGSRARGTATAKSDYDIIGLNKSGKNERHLEVFNGAPLDINIYDIDTYNLAESKVNPLFWDEAVVLFQQHHEGEQFIKGAKKAFYDQKIPSEKKTNTIRLLSINLNRSQENTIKENFYRHRFLAQALAQYFPIHDLVYMGPRKSFEWLKKHDPLTYAAFEKALTPNADKETLYALLERVIGPEIHRYHQDQRKLSKVNTKNKKYVLSQDPLLPEIVRYLKTNFGAHTIILFGSRSQGVASSKSDYDFIGLRGVGTPEEKVRDLFKGVYLDLHLYPEDIIHGMNMVGLLGMTGGATILCQKNELGNYLIKRIKNVYNKGFFVPERIKKEIVDEIKMNMSKIDDTVGGRYYQNYLLSSVLEHYFTLRNRYYIGARQSFMWIKENDLSTYQAFEKALKPGANMRSVKELVDRVIDTPQLPKS